MALEIATESPELDAALVDGSCRKPRPLPQRL